MKKFNLKSLLFYTLIPLMLSFTVSMLIPSYNSFYEELEKPFTLPPIVFIIVWTVLYILMGVSAYLVDNSGKENIKSSLIIYYVQLFINLAWPIVFFGFNKILLAAGMIVLLLMLVIVMAIKFSKFNKVSGYLLIPYILWLVVASYLNISIYILNN